jgi:hypothetical protein
MERHLKREERQLCNRLTAVKLALQILERKTPLSDRQRGLVQRAIEGMDALSAVLLRRMHAERSRPVSWEPLGTSAGCRGSTDIGTPQPSLTRSEEKRRTIRGPGGSPFGQLPERSLLFPVVTVPLHNRRREMASAVQGFPQQRLYFLPLPLQRAEPPIGGVWHGLCTTPALALAGPRRFGGIRPVPHRR